MSLYPSNNIFPNKYLFAGISVTFAFDETKNYNSIKTSRKNATLLSDLDNNIIGGREKTNNVTSLSKSISLSPSKIQGNKIK